MPVPNYESLPLQQRSIYNLSGGMVTSYNFSYVKNNEVLRVLNADLYSDGSIFERYGRSKLNKLAIAGNPRVRHLATIGGSFSDLIFAVAGTNVFEVSTGIVGPSIRTVVDNAVTLTTNLDNFLFFVDGTDIPFMTQGTPATTFRNGVVPPASHVGFTATSAAGGDATIGQHRITFRYRSTITGARSNPFISANAIQFITLAAAITAGNQTYSITFPAGLVSTAVSNADTSVAQVDIIDYFVQEADALVDAPYYYLGSSPNAAGVYNFNSLVSDDELIVKERLDIDDNVAPSSLKDIEEWRGRLLGISGNYTVRYSKQRVDANGIINLPTSWPATNELQVGFGDGDFLVKIVRFVDYVFAFKKRSVWLLVGEFGTPGFGFRRLKTNYTNIGLLNPKAVTQAGDSIYFVSDDLKFHSFTYTDFSTTELRLKDPPLSDPVADIFTTFANSFRNNISVLNFSFSQYTQVWISFSDGASGFSADQNYNLFVYDYTVNDAKGAWHIHTGHSVASAVLAKNQDDYRVYTGDYFGFVWRHDFSHGDGAEINGTSTGGNALNTLNDLTKNFTADLIGVFIRIIGGTGVNQIRRITAVPALTQVQIAPNWVTIPDNTSEYTIGGIDFEVWSRFDWCDDQTPVDFIKLGWYLDIDVEAMGTAPQKDANNNPVYVLDVQIFKDRGLDPTQPVVRRFIDATGAIWGRSIWGTAIWGGTAKALVQVGFNKYFRQIWHKLISQYAGQQLKINGWTYTFQNQNQMRIR